MRRLRKLGADERGGAIVEFALVLPLMLLMLMGTVELVQVFETQRRVSHVAYVVADLVAQERSVTNASLGDMARAGLMVLDPLPADTLGLRVASYPANDQGVLQKDPAWFWPGPVPYAGDAPLTAPAGKVDPKRSVIVADVSYTYTPALTWLLPKTMTFSKRAVLRPRVVDAVARTGS